MDVFTRSVNGMANYSFNMFVFTIGNREEFAVSEFYKEVVKVCNSLKLSYFHIPSFDYTYYWERDAHYNKKGSKQAASLVYQSLMLSE